MQHASNIDTPMFMDCTASGSTYQCTDFTFNNVVVSQVNYIGATIGPFRVTSRSIQINNTTFTNIGENTYTNYALKSLTPFFGITLRKPYTNTVLVTETVTVNLVTLNQLYGGVNGRFMNIAY